MTNIASTYRIQFHKDFTLKDLDKIIPYLTQLGVATLYASPIFAAVEGSTHGYDSISPHQINPEIGTEAELLEVSKKLRANGISWLQDIVPNHMAFHHTNAWLMDVLENWDQSKYFNFFDLNFPNKLDDPRLMVPFLAETLANAINQGKVTLQLSADKLYLTYGENHWPVNRRTYQLLSKEYQAIGDIKNAIKKQGDLKKLSKAIEEINQNEKLLQTINDVQYYRLCHWQETEGQLNYRRFFTVNGLICLNIQHEDVFKTYHQYILKLVKEGIFQGLRIDHIDGLADPSSYLENLRKLVGPDIYIVVEKILGADEELVADWPIQGNTGYDFLAMVNNVFTNRAAEKPFNRLYQEVIHKPLKVAEQIILKKRAILFEHMRGELDHLEQFFLDLQLLSKNDLKSLPKNSLKNAIADFIVYCPVYRYYGTKFPLSTTERDAIKDIFVRIEKSKSSNPATTLLESIFLNPDKKRQEKIAQFYQRCMQFSGPLMAKGVEDTLMYTYNRFIGHTEVGDAPDAFGLSISSFHKRMSRRAETWPYSMNGTSTHDTKRGEDVRARLNVITDMPERWKKLVAKLRKNTSKTAGRGFNIHHNDAYLIFQTLLGAIPFASNEEHDLDERLSQYIEKALREAKKRSDWAEPNEEYETATKKFATALIDKTQPNYALLTNFLEEITDYSIINSLSQLMLKFTCPGIPDLYQGTELWDLSLVDPDNRRPVDYQLRQQLLEEVQTANLSDLWKQRTSGKIKLWLTHTLLKCRKDHPMLFSDGKYIPLSIKGFYKKNILAFLRKHGGEYFLVVIPLGLANISGQSPFELQTFNWKNTEIVIPPDLPSPWENVLTGKTGQKRILSKGIRLDEILTDFPMALLKFSVEQKERGSGILLHISSLPSGFGIGDLGPNAFEFIDTLANTKQQYWQMLPLNPSTALQCYSPYSSYSAMAGNTMLISPSVLAKQGLLSDKDLSNYHIADSTAVNYPMVEQHKARLLQLAYKNYLKNGDPKMQQDFAAFCKTEQNWLTDFALFSTLRKHHQLLAWNKWPEKYKLRDQAALAEFSQHFAAEITEAKWQQFIFNQQWRDLKDYAHANHIKLIGDLPFYVAYDSVDVWANTSLFKLDQNLEMTVVSGVPPDLFNDDGQIWGMPIFEWEVLQKQNYAWWIKRLEQNISMFDLLRLDHFRAFHTYWEIPIQDKTAKNGTWIEGPGASFFEVVAAQFKNIPFIVEDLGGDMEGPIQLRDKFKLPGMKVLQFGFGEDMAFSTHLPHNYKSNNFMVYTGTHDNNTAKGWYRKELDTAGRNRLSLYLGKKVDEKNVNLELIKMAIASSAKISIIPLQDLLGLTETARMNTPAQTWDNWLWRFEKGGITQEMKNWLLQQTELFGR